MKDDYANKIKQAFILFIICLFFAAAFFYGRNIGTKYQHLIVQAYQNAADDITQIIIKIKTALEQTVLK